MAGRTISKELKAQIVSAYRQGEKMKNIAELYGVSYPTVSKLVRASANSSVSLVGIKKACPKCGKDKHEKIKSCQENLTISQKQFVFVCHKQKNPIERRLIIMLQF